MGIVTGDCKRDAIKGRPPRKTVKCPPGEALPLFVSVVVGMPGPMGWLFLPPLGLKLSSR
jgi:hypothetical protein